MCLKSNTEILSGEGLSELPISWSHVPGGGGSSITARHSKRELLAYQNGVGLPVLTPVTAHAQPTGVGSFHAHLHNIPCTRHVGDQNQVEITESVDSESNSTLLSAWHSVNQSII